MWSTVPFCELSRLAGWFAGCSNASRAGCRPPGRRASGGRAGRLPLDQQAAALAPGAERIALAVVVGRRFDGLQVVAVPGLTAAMAVAIGREAHHLHGKIDRRRHDQSVALAVERETWLPIGWPLRNAEKISDSP